MFILNILIIFKNVYLKTSVETTLRVLFSCAYMYKWSGLPILENVIHNCSSKYKLLSKSTPQCANI